MRMQFGDVPADFIRVDDPVAKPLDLKVPDLFGYAVHNAGAQKAPYRQDSVI